MAASALVAGLGGVAGAAGGPAPAATSLDGGTLRVGIPVFKIAPVRTPTVPVDLALEPARQPARSPRSDRCCLLRTLLSYNGEPTERGGAVLRPDLADAMPTQSSDGRTWTFHLKPGLHYGPPLQKVEITAQDVIRAIKRPITPLKPPLNSLLYTPDVYAPIVGLKAYRSGRVGSVSGLEAPDAHTLVVHLTRATGNLGYTFSLPFTAPVPAASTRGHSGLDFSRFLVSTGPYMIGGSERMEFSRPARDQAPAAGYRPGRSITLVRNPNWKRATDPLRAAYPDRIVITYGGTVEGDARKVDRGALDLVFDALPPRSQVARYRADARLRARLHANRSDVLYFDAMNLAVPPFDDLHVRRAVNLAIDKRRLLHLFERSPDAPFWGGTGVSAGHLIVGQPRGRPASRLGSFTRRPGSEEVSSSRDARCAARATTGTTTVAATERSAASSRSVKRRRTGPFGLSGPARPGGISSASGSTCRCGSSHGAPGQRGYSSTRGGGGRCSSGSPTSRTSRARRRCSTSSTGAPSPAFRPA